MNGIINFFLNLQNISKKMIKNTSYQPEHTTTDKFEKLVNRLYISLCYTANRILGDKTAAQDIVQEAFARLWELQEKNRQIENIDNYLYMLVHNLSLEWQRTRKLQAKYQNQHPLKEIDIFNDIVEADVTRQFFEEVVKLPPRSQEIIELTLKGLDNKQIAKELQISINSVKTLKYKSIKKLKLAFSSEILKTLVFFLR